MGALAFKAVAMIYASVAIAVSAIIISVYAQRRELHRLLHVASVALSYILLVVVTAQGFVIERFEFGSAESWLVMVAYALGAYGLVKVFPLVKKRHDMAQRKR